jgi:CubicO group peptidase (beta-lactamase class C family)
MDRRPALDTLVALAATAELRCPTGEDKMTTPTDPANIQRLHDAMAARISRGDLPGLVCLVSDGTPGNEVHVETLGRLGIGRDEPMQRDTIFRIASMTKPMVAAVAMTLIEDQTLALDAPALRWLPELADRRVLRRIDGPLDDTVPATRAITVRDLLTFRMGFGMVWGPPDALPILRAESALHLGAFGPPRVQEPPAPDEWMRRFATLPLMNQPGEVWRYNTSAEVLGVLLARASGRPLDVLMRERLFAPLGMVDTGFWVAPDKTRRLATSYVPNPTTGALDVYDTVADGQWSHPPAFLSGGAGLVSTLDDCFAFARMMSAGGTLGNVRVLSRASVLAMTTDAVTPTQKAASNASLDPTFWQSFGWGFGCAVVVRPEAAGPFGAGWDGGLGTSMWWSKGGAIGILLTQRAAYPKTSPVYLDFWRCANEMQRAG